MSSIPFDELSTASNPGFSYYGRVGLSFWMTTICSTTIHELGHFLAFYKYGVPVSEFCVGSQKGKYIWERNMYFSQSCSTRIIFNFLKPFDGHVVARFQNLCVWKKMKVATAGPIAQLSTMGIVFCLTNKHLKESKKNGTLYNPFVFGACLASGMGISIAILNFLPIKRYSDGHRIFEDFYAISQCASL